MRIRWNGQPTRRPRLTGRFTFRPSSPGIRLWDEHEEEADPQGERILDEGRLTMITTPLDAQPVAIARIAKDTIKPLLVALALFVICGALAFRMMWVVWPTVAFALVVLALWLRPNPETENA